QQEVGEKFHFPLQRWIRDPLRFHFRGNAHARVLHQQQVHKYQQYRQPRQDRDMESKESTQRGSRDLFAAAKKNHHGSTDKWNLSSDLGADLGSKECQRVPWQQVAAETETHHEKEEDHAADPRKLARLAVCLKEQHTEHVCERSENHQVSRPGVDRSNQPAILHLGHDVLHASERFIGSGPIAKKQQDPSQHLDDEQEERDTAKEVPIRE